MKIEVSKLNHHPKNQEIYNLSSIEELIESISELGLLQPLVIDQYNQIISGNRRFESIKRLGWNEVEIEKRVVLDKLEEKQSGVAHKPANYYKFNKKRYETYLESGFFKFEF